MVSMDTRCFCQLLLLISLLYVTRVCSALDDAKESAQRLLKMYEILHNLALPKALYGGPTSKRLVMMLPGKVLYEKDYYPGKDYVDFITDNARDKDQFVEIPPFKMQNLFNLVDVVPGVDPFQGQESGESFSAYYREVLGQMDIKGLDQLTEDQQKHLQESVKILLEEVNDPAAPDNNISRWDLYRRYEVVYNNERERMEKEINDQRNALTSIEYQYWFQRTYPALQAKVDGAFYDWLISGQKDLVELHKGRLGTSSPGALLLEAKSVLRATGNVALDRSKTIYPVNFVPGNWYDYLKDPVVTLSPDQINIRLGQLQAQKAFLETIGSYKGADCGIDNEVGKSGRAYTGTTDQLRENGTAVMTKRCKCLVAGGNTEDSDCQEFQGALDLTLENAQEVAFQYQGKAALEAIQSGNKEAVDTMVRGIDNQINELTTQLPGSSILSDVGGASDQIAGNAPRAPWLYFSWNSEESQQTETSSQSSFSTQTSFQASFGLFSIGGSFGYSKSTANAFSSLKQDKVKVAGEIMRVSVQMPWFRPELFRNEKLTLRKNTAFSVSPGTKSSDREFVQAVKDSTKTGKHYRIPQYITGLLLCRNLDLEISGIDQQSTRSFVATSMSGGLDVGYGPFSLSTKFSSSNQRASFRASSTATGLQIKVAGAQVIGYYTEVVPQFPVEDTGE